MTIFKTMVGFSDGDGKIYRVDTIEYQGAFWLVPEWLDHPEKGFTAPARIICLDGLFHQKTPKNPGGDFVLNQGIPKTVFDGTIPPRSGDKYTVIEHPDIKIPIQGSDH